MKRIDLKRLAEILTENISYLTEFGLISEEDICVHTTTPNLDKDIFFSHFEAVDGIDSYAVVSFLFNNKKPAHILFDKEVLARIVGELSQLLTLISLTESRNAN